MKQKKLINYICCCFMLVVALSCDSKWEEHYAAATYKNATLEIYPEDAQSYIRNQGNLSEMDSIFNNNSIYSKLSKDHTYTILVYTNDKLEANRLGDLNQFANYCISDVSFSPAQLKNGMGLRMRLGKNIWVSVKNDSLYIDDYKVIKTVKATNAYIYYVGNVVPVRASINDFLSSLGSDYSIFKALVRKQEEIYFDKENSNPKGVDNMGNTIYDSIITVRNKLMDRYTPEGLPYWDMRSEDYLSTMLIPSNRVIYQAIQKAIECIPKYLGREATAQDTTKFQEWIVKSCFLNKRLNKEDLSRTNDITCVGGSVRNQEDEKKFDDIDAAMWRTSVQKVDTNNPVTLSNGTAYFVNYLKIPNNIIIYRLKAKFYELWGAMTDVQKAQYFQWDHWIEPLIVNNAQSEFTLSAGLPTMYYHVLTAIPDAAAKVDSLPCRVTYQGLLYNSVTKKISVANVPAGEYYLRMGFKHSLMYSISIYFNDSLLVRDMVLHAQGSNFHFDRGSVSTMDYYGSMAIGYPENFNWKEWFAKDIKSVAYDTDGYQVAIVNVPKEGGFKITIESSDDSYLYDPTAGRGKNNVTQLMMYHWCLRPTGNNY